MTIQPLTNQYEDILNLWNREVGETFFIPTDLFRTQIVESFLLDKKRSQVVYENEKLIGFILVKSAKSHQVKSCQNTIWISLMHIAIANRKKGIGSLLMKNALKNAKEEGYHQVLLGKDIRNLFSGVPVIFRSIGFFQKQGFVGQEIATDMINSVAGDAPFPLRKKTEYTIQLATISDQEDIKVFFHKVFPDRWLYEYETYIKNNGEGREFVIIKKDDMVVAFCRINDQRSPQNMNNRHWRSHFTNLIGVGPLGVDADYRGMDLGYDVTAFAINEAVARGATEIIIDWTSKIAFYKKFGFEIWRQYWSLSMDLRG